MDKNKFHFITVETFELMQALHESTPAKWGVMNAQEMTEHLADFYDISSEKIPCKLYTPEEHLPKMKAFLLSDKNFRENTKAPAEMLGEQPLPLRFSNPDEAKINLQLAVNNFTKHFTGKDKKETLHPAFGMLNYEEWVLLHYKHVQHHLKQFGLIPVA